MEQPTTVRKKFAIFALIAAFLIGAVVGAAGYACWMRLRPDPLFSFDPGEVTQIHIQGQAAWGSDGNIVTIIDKERIEHIVELLNGLPCQPITNPEPTMGWNTSLKLFTANGVSWVYFSTHDNGEPDTVYIKNPDSGGTLYTTASGYFWELTKMPSTHPPAHEPENPGPSAQPEQP